MGLESTAIVEHGTVQVVAGFAAGQVTLTQDVARLKFPRMLVLAAFWSAALEPTFVPLAAQHDMSRMNEGPGISLPLGLSIMRIGSGTSWLPDSSSQSMIHAALGGWSAMAHGAAFGQYDKQNTIHGASQFGLVDWEMATA